MIIAMITKNKITKNICHYHHQRYGILIKIELSMWRRGLISHQPKYVEKSPPLPRWNLEEGERIRSDVYLIAMCRILIFNNQ